MPVVQASVAWAYLCMELPPPTTTAASHAPTKPPLYPVGTLTLDVHESVTGLYISFLVLLAGRDPPAMTWILSPSVAAKAP